MKVKYFIILTALIGLISRCSSQNKGNIIFYDTETLFKERTYLSDSAYAYYAHHYYLLPYVEEVYKYNTKVPKEEILKVMKSIVPNTFDPQYIKKLQNASSKNEFEQLLKEAISIEDSEYQFEKCYSGENTINTRFYEVVNTMGSSGYAEEFPFELKNGKLIALENLEVVANVIEKNLTQLFKQRVARSLSSKYGATFIKGKEYLLFSYCKNSNNCPGYQFDIAVAYDVDSGDLYYAIGDFGGEKTSVPAGNIFWKYLGVYSKS